MQIYHSEWVTSVIWVVQTIYQTLWEQVPLFSWFGAIIGWFWNAVIKPVLILVSQTISTLRTWVENVVRWVVERIQNGWNYITRTIAEQIGEWVEQTDWVKEWVTKEITVWDTVWDIVPVPLPANLLARLGLTATMVSLMVLAAECSSPTPSPIPAPDYVATLTACLVQSTQTAAAQTAVAAYTPTPIPTPTVTPFQFPSNKVFTAIERLSTCNDVALYFGISLADLQAANPDLNCDAVNIGITKFNIPPITLKTPSEYVSQYTCTPTTEKPKCLSPDATVEEMIAYTLFNEGGSSEGNQFSANVMQVMLNHANKVLDNWGIDRNQMSREDYARMVLYVISKPAAAGANVAAFEAFPSPSEPPADGSENWNDALQIAQSVLDNKGVGWAQKFPLLDEEIAKQDVLFYCSVNQRSGNPPLGSTVQIPQPGGDSPGGVYTYFFNGYQYDQSVAQWCQDNR